ncbi:MAG: 2OG-Fe(II) oxygenase family protein [Rhodospirillaceae bacterium]
MFIEEYPGLVAPDLCERIITKFESDPHTMPSVINVAGYSSVSDVRTGTSLPCPLTGDWKALIEQLIPALNTALKRYAATYQSMRNLIDNYGLHCTSPIIERVDPGQGFNWHCDQTMYSSERVLTSLLYLRTVREGGATEFLQQKRSIQPEAGKIALFPSAWTHLHRGASPTSEIKYVACSFWVYDKSKVGK